MKNLLRANPAKVLRASKLRIGELRAQGVPAILLGAAAIVLAAGAMRALREGAPNLPETIRELRSLLESTRREAKKLNP
ncbi:MAG: hypothetical protein NVSMB5_01310 [Candidatus Velthaea sp.]